MKIFLTVSLDVMTVVWNTGLKGVSCQAQKEISNENVNSANRLCQLFSVDALSECNV